MLISEHGDHYAIRITKQLAERLAEEGIFRRHRLSDPVIDEKENVILPKSARIEPYTNFFSLGNLCTMGAFSYTYARMPAGVSAGRYCSIAANLQVFGLQHPTDRATTSVLGYDRYHLISQAAAADFNSTMAEIKPSPQKGPPVLGNDVWVGQNVTMARGITIGDGAIIGMNAVVTKSVAPFSIVGGNPARVIRQRFPDELCERYLQTRWWDYALPECGGVDVNDPVRFIDEIEAMIADGKIQKYTPKALDAAAVLALI